MDVSVTRCPGGCRGWRTAAFAALAAFSTAAVVAGQGPPRAPDVVLKAAFLYNFAKFAEWPALRAGQPIAVCIIGDDGIAAAFDQTAQGQHIGGRSVVTTRPADPATWSACHILFIGADEARRLANGLLAIRAAPVLTVSDGPGFARRSGLVELYVEDGRMRFAVNVDALQRTGLLLSSRLLGLAKVIKDRDLD